MAQKRLMYKISEAAIKTRYQKNELLQKAAEGGFSFYIKVDKSKVLALVKDGSPTIGSYNLSVVRNNGDLHFPKKYFISAVDLDFVPVWKERVSDILSCGESFFPCVFERPIFLGIQKKIKVSSIYLVCTTLVYLNVSSGMSFCYGLEVTDSIVSFVVCEDDLWMSCDDVEKYTNSVDRGRSGRGPGLVSVLIKNIVDNDFSGVVPSEKRMIDFFSGAINREIYGCKILYKNDGNSIFFVESIEGGETARVTSSSLKSALQRQRGAAKNQPANT